MPLDLKPVKKEELSLTPAKEELSLISVSKPQKQLFLKPLDVNVNLLQMTGEEDTFARMTKFQKILDIIGRPGFAMKSLINFSIEEQERAFNRAGLTEMERRSPSNPKRLAAIRTIEPNIKEKFNVMWKGLSGKDRHTMNEIWGKVGVKGVPFLGFASELAVDPLMWGGGAGYRAILWPMKKGVRLTAAGIKAIPGVTKATTAVAMKTQPVASALKEMFVTKTGLRKLNEFIDFYLSKRQYLRGKELGFAVKTRNVIQNVARKTGHSIDDIERNIVNLIELPEKTAALAPETRVLANTLKSHLSNILTKEMKAGVPITALSKNARGIQYFPRITTAEARQYLKQARIGNSRVWNTKLANALRRKTEDFTLDEFNAFVRAHGLESLGGRSVEEFFMKQPAYAVYVRGIRSAKAVTSVQFLDDVGKTFGSKTNPGYYQQLPDAITKLNPRLKDLWFDPEVASEITRTTTQYINPQQAKVFMRGFDTVQNLWKKWTLAPFPKYHLRNMVGNIWNIYLEGSTGPRHFAQMQALQTYKKYKNSPKMGKFALAELRKLKITPQQADDLILQLEQTGAVGRGWYAADIETGLQKEFGLGFLHHPLRIKAKKLVTGEIITEKGMAFGSTIENNARGALFLARLEKGDDALKAATTVKKFLFDYGDLTAFEKQVMKRLMPFYTWTRKNVPLQLEMLWKKPQKFAPLGVPLRGRDPQDLLRLKYTRPQLYERLPVELRRDADTVTYVPLEGLIPAGDLAKMVRPQEMFIELITPYLRAPIELRMNKSFYFESEIQRYPKETQELLRTDVPVKLKYTMVSVLPQARMLNELNKLVKKQVRKEELTAGEQAFAQSLSSIYKINLKDLRDRALRRVEKKIQDLERGMFWAKRYERTKEERRIRETYQELKDLMKEIKGK